MLLAVVGHSLPDVTKGFNIIGEASFSEFLYHWIYSFHMATFFACAGFLMLPKLSAQINVKEQLHKRFMRLMVPYFFYSFLYLAMKTIFGAIADHPLSDNALLGLFLGDSPCFGAWFLWTLFVISVIVILMRKLPLSLILVVALCMCIANVFVPDGELFIGVKRVLSNMVWFVSGGVFGVYYQYITKWSKPMGLAIIGISLLTILQFVHFEKCSTMTVLLPYIKGLAGMIGSWGLMMFVKPYTESSIRKLMKLIGDNCMDIYMLSMYVLVPMRIIYVNLGLMNYVNYYVWVVIAAITGIVIPILLSKHIVSRNKYAKMLLIGG